MTSKSQTNPRKLPQQDRSKFTVDAILTATAHILTAEGYDKASTNRIAERAGISIGSLYQYFPNKASLIAALRARHVSSMMEVIESKLRDLFDAPIAVVLPEIVKASIAAHAIDPTLHKVLHEQVPRLSGTEMENRMTDLLRSYLAKQCDTAEAVKPPAYRIQPQKLDYTVFVIERSIEALTHAAVIECSDLLQDGHLEQEINEMLLSYLTQKLAHLASPTPAY
ncbi:TetR/AcrR family transcriptional regulator [Nostoc sp. MG11]|uniref:TetR/AcrR family transcriptional regulator n=1 Tax=Nostoc sp. MG11 TaxID=2721166 RepID=UPI00186636EC|nr:TetR/AcrR family transcriptional regulator [Nostoc sp. MG11]